MPKQQEDRLAQLDKERVALDKQIADAQKALAKLNAEYIKLTTGK